VGFRSAVRELFRRDEPVTEAAPRALAPQATPERSGFEYGIPSGGMTETRQGMGASTQTDRRSLMQQLYEAYLACPWSWAAVNAIARTATAGGMVTDWDGDDGEGDKEAPAKPDNVLALERLFQFCNPREDIRQLMRGVITDLSVFGDAFLEVVWVGNVPVALYSLDCPSMFPIADEHGTISGYKQVTEFGQRADFEPRDVIHISLDSPRSGIFGVSPTQAALLPITAWLFAAATSKEVFRKGNPPHIHVDFPANSGQPEINRWDAMYMARNVGPRNIGVPITTKGGAKINELKQGSVVEYIDFLNQKRDEVLATYGVPPAEAGVIESGNLGGGTGESQHKMFMTNTVSPIAELVLEKINFHIVKMGFGITGWHAKFRDVDMRDSKTVEEIRDLRVRSGLWTLDRGRADIGEPAVPGGDQAMLAEKAFVLRWADMEAASQAHVASLAKGTSLDVDEPSAGEPLRMLKPEPAPVPDVLKPFAGVDNPPADGEQPDQPDGQPPQLAAKKTGKQPPDDGAATETAIDADWRAVSESWSRDYRTRRQRALAELPGLASVP
jgi:hypothetical protein